MIDTVDATYAVALENRMKTPKPNALFLLLSGNAGGVAMFCLVMPTLEATRDYDTRARAVWAGTRTVIALRRYEARHGELPLSLSDLVPEFLDEVPRDPYDGEPLRYSREARMVRCVGEDLEEGEPGDHGTDALEPTFRLK